MPVFRGFSAGLTHQTPIPAAFFGELLPQIDDLGELKVILYIFNRLESVEGGFRYVSRSDIQADAGFMAGLAANADQVAERLADALRRAVKRGALLEAQLDTRHGPEAYYFLNSPKGRAALRAIQSGQWRPPDGVEVPVATPPPRETPNIFRLYEENIGPLTPLMADTLGDAEDTYPADWIEEAIRIAVERNKRTWRYIAAILERWQREGKYDRKEKLENRSDTPEARRKYIEGDYSDFVEH
jgi:DnaD/phage-associated family protein